MFQDETFQWSRKSQVFYIAVTKMQNYWQIFVNIVTLFTRSVYRFLKYIEDSHLGFSEIVRFSAIIVWQSWLNSLSVLRSCPSRSWLWLKTANVWEFERTYIFDVLLWCYTCVVHCTSWTHARMYFVRKYKCRKCDQIQWNVRKQTVVKWSGSHHHIPPSAAPLLQEVFLKVVIEFL